MSLSTLSDINNCIFANNNPTVINTGLLAIFTNGIYFTQFYFNIYNNSILTPYNGIFAANDIFTISIDKYNIYY